MNNEPVAWAIKSNGDFTEIGFDDDDLENIELWYAEQGWSYEYVPLYTHPVKELILTNEKILEVIKELEHSICFSEGLGFFELKEFAEAILRKASEK